MSIIEGIIVRSSRILDNLNYLLCQNPLILVGIIFLQKYNDCNKTIRKLNSRSFICQEIFLFKM